MSHHTNRPPVGVFHTMWADVVLYPSQYSLMYAFARFQEFYEGEQLRGIDFPRHKVESFHLQRAQQEAELARTFGRKPELKSYYDTWNGCNIPGAVWRQAKETLTGFDAHERLLMAEVPDATPYVIGVHAQHPDLTGVLLHEFAHGIYASDLKYQSKALELMTERYTTLAPIRARLSVMGYAKHVIPDEVQAYAVSGIEKLKLTNMPHAVSALMALGDKLRPGVLEHEDVERTIAVVKHAAALARLNVPNGSAAEWSS